MTLTGEQTLKVHLAALENRRDFLYRKAQEGRALAELAALIYVIELLHGSPSEGQTDNATTPTSN